MFQRISLYWVLSVLSPVLTAKASGAPYAGPTPISLIRRTIASATCTESISLGRYEPVTLASPAKREPGSLYRSRNSTRAGD